MAFGGEAAGNMKANDVDNAAGNIKYNGFNSKPRACKHQIQDKYTSNTMDSTQNPEPANIKYKTYISKDRVSKIKIKKI